MIKKLLEKLNDKAKANNYVIEITCGVRTEDLLKKFNENFQDDLKEYNNRIHNLIFYDAYIIDGGEFFILDNFIMDFDFYTYEDYKKDHTRPRMKSQIKFDDFTEFHRKLSFLVNNLK